MITPEAAAVTSAGFVANGNLHRHVRRVAPDAVQDQVSCCTRELGSYDRDSSLTPESARQMPIAVRQKPALARRHVPKPRCIVL
jgi:hypothetical protein